MSHRYGFMCEDDGMQSGTPIYVRQNAVDLYHSLDAIMAIQASPAYDGEVLPLSFTDYDVYEVVAYLKDHRGHKIVLLDEYDGIEPIPAKDAPPHDVPAEWQSGLALPVHFTAADLQRLADLLGIKGRLPYLFEIFTYQDLRGQGTYIGHLLATVVLWRQGAATDLELAAAIQDVPLKPFPPSPAA